PLSFEGDGAAERESIARTLAPIVTKSAPFVVPGIALAPARGRGRLGLRPRSPAAPGPAPARAVGAGPGLVPFFATRAWRASLDPSADATGGPDGRRAGRSGRGRNHDRQRRTT